MMITKGIQDDILTLGKNGCAFLTVCRAFNLELNDIPKLIVECQNNKSIDNEYFVNSWKDLLETIDPKKRKWTVKKQTEYEPCDILIGMFEKGKNTHFVLLNAETKAIIYDSLYNSQTVKYGVLKDYRICKFIR